MGAGETGGLYLYCVVPSDLCGASGSKMGTDTLTPELAGLSLEQAIKPSSAVLESTLAALSSSHMPPACTRRLPCQPRTSTPSQNSPTGGSGLTSLDGGAVRVLSQGGLSVLIHDCEAEPYQGSDDQVRGWVLAHNAVVVAAWELAGAVLPMSFDSIVVGDGSRTAEVVLAQWLERNRGNLTSQLDRLQGQVELGVRIANPERRAQELTPAAVARGREYFRQQAQRRRERREQQTTTDELAREFFDALAARSASVRLKAPRSGATTTATTTGTNTGTATATATATATGTNTATTNTATTNTATNNTNTTTGVGRGTEILAVSLLVPRSEIYRVGDYLDTVIERGYEVRFTGPWPPYSFVGSVDVAELNSAQLNSAQPRK